MKCDTWYRMGIEKGGFDFSTETKEGVTRSAEVWGDLVV